MKNTKLYVLQQNGIVKLGITSNEDVQTRITQINKDLPEGKKFQLVVEFEVNESPAMIERFVHDYLGVNQLNIQYLKNKMVLVDVDYVNSSQTGYTEFFLADKDKIKQVITLFGILDYINVDTQSLNKLNNIKEYSFDFFADKHLEFLKMCESALRINQNGSNYRKSTLLEALSNTSDKIKADFIIEDNTYYLLLGNSKVSLEELTKPNNQKYVEELLSSNKLEIENKEGQTLYAIIRKFRENNKETSLQPLASMQKELKDRDFKEWLNNKNGNKKILDIVSRFDGDMSEAFAYELLGLESVYLKYYKKALSEMTKLSTKDSKKIEQAIKILQKKDTISPNFSSPILFPRLIKLIEKDDLILTDGAHYIMMSQSVNMISSIFKIIYNSKDKISDITKIDHFMTSVDNYCKKLYDNENITRRQDPLFWKLEESILIICKTNNIYFELAETIMKTYGLSENNEKRLLNKVKNK